MLVLSSSIAIVLSNTCFITIEQAEVPDWLAARLAPGARGRDGGSSGSSSGAEDELDADFPEEWSKLPPPQRSALWRKCEQLVPRPLDPGGSGLSLKGAFASTAVRAADPALDAPSGLQAYTYIYIYTYNVCIYIYIYT